MGDDSVSAAIETYQNDLVDRDDADDQEIFDMLEAENDQELAGYREQRMQELAELMSDAKQGHREGAGEVTEIDDEKQLMEICRSSPTCVVHFYHDNFKRCKIMDERLKIIARKHLSTRFLRISVGHAPFLVAKLKIQILPLVIGYIQGREVLRLVGFEDLGNSDSFTTRALEVQLFKAGILNRRALDLSAESSSNSQMRQPEESDDDDY